MEEAQAGSAEVLATQKGWYSNLARVGMATHTCEPSAYFTPSCKHHKLIFMYSHPSLRALSCRQMDQSRHTHS